MSGCHDGFVTQFAGCAENSVARIWCAAHKINIIVVKTAAEGVNSFRVKNIYTFSVLIYAQNNLLVEKNVKCLRNQSLGASWPPFSILSFVSMPAAAVQSQNLPIWCRQKNIESSNTRQHLSLSLTKSCWHSYKLKSFWFPSRKFLWKV